MSMINMHNVLENPQSNEEVEALNDYIRQRSDLVPVGPNGETCSISANGDETVISDVAVGRCPACGEWTYAQVDRPRTECCGRIEPSEPEGGE